MAADTNKIDLTIDDIISSWGEYYPEHGQNMSNLHQLPFEESDTQTGGTIVETDQTVLREANVETDEVLQPFQIDFTSKGGVTILPVEIKLQNIKIDVGVTPHTLINAWTGFLTDSGNDPLTYPFIQWLTTNYLVGKAKEDFELKAIYTGVHAAPTQGTAGAAIDAIDGIEKIQNDLVAADKVTPFTTGDLSAMTDANFVTAIEENFAMAIPEKYRYNYQMELSMSRSFRDKFRRGMRAKYNVNYEQTDMLNRLMDYENITVVGRASMTGKKRIWTTPKFNLLFPVKGFSNKSVFDVQKQDRKVKFLTDWWQGVGFVQPELVFMNEAEVPES
jgi:hypothetical protein